MRSAARRYRSPSGPCRSRSPRRLRRQNQESLRVERRRGEPDERDRSTPCACGVDAQHERCASTYGRIAANRACYRTCGARILLESARVASVARPSHRSAALDHARGRSSHASAPVRSSRARASVGRMGPSCPCFFCGGPAHPATGCVYSERVIACYACVVSFWRWFRGHMATRSRPGRDKKGRMQADFYTAAATGSRAASSRPQP